MQEYSYINIVIVSLLRGMNSDSPWRGYYAANRITGSTFWFCFNLFGRFVLMRMFLESIAVSQVRRSARSLRIELNHRQYGLLQEKYVVQVRAPTHLPVCCGRTLMLQAVHHAAVLRQGCRKDMLRRRF